MTQKLSRHLTKAETELVAALIDNPGATTDELTAMLNRSKESLRVFLHRARRKGVDVRFGYYVRVS
jgi:predicted transcriptional regulator